MGNPEDAKKSNMVQPEWSIPNFDPAKIQREENKEKLRSGIPEPEVSSQTGQVSNIITYVCRKAEGMNLVYGIWYSVRRLDCVLVCKGYRARVVPSRERSYSVVTL